MDSDHLDSSVTDDFDVICPNCHQGPESCVHCQGLSRMDFETICDCGLYDFGSHLISCELTHEALA